MLAVLGKYRLAYCKQSNTEWYIHAKARNSAVQVTMAIFIAQMSVFMLGSGGCL